jgi:hypothetical protein
MSRVQEFKGGMTGGDGSFGGRLWLKEGVGVALVADGGGRAVAGMDDGIIGELEELGLQGIHKLIIRAAPEIGAANAAGEEGVACKELRLGELDLAGVFGEI